MATVEEVCREQIAFSYEGLDRIILNGYLPHLQTPGAVYYFFRTAWNCPIPSPVLFQRWTDRFVESIHAFAAKHDLAVIRTGEDQKPGDVARPLLKRAARENRFGLVAIIVHQEKARAFSSRHLKGKKKSAFKIYRTTRRVHHYYFYLRDRDYGEAFIRICSYVPFPLRIWLNGHGWLHAQLQGRGIDHRMWENSFIQVADPTLLQGLADGFGVPQITRFLERWMAQLPLPLTEEEQRGGYRWAFSLYQLELCHNLVFRDRGTLNRLYEPLLKDCLHLGRPELLKIFFGRQIRKNTPSRHRLRVLRDGAVSCLKVYYKKSFLKQYNKGGRLLRTELCINDPRDFGVRKGLTNLAYLRQIAHHATGRFLKAQAVALHTALSRSAFDRIVAPSHQGGKRVPGLRLGAPRAMLLLEALGSVGLLLRAFRHGDLRRCILGLPHAPERYSPTQMSYDLRKLCGKGLIRKVPGKNLYTVTDSGHRAAQFFPKLYHRALTPTCQVLLSPQFQPALAHSHDSIDRAVAKVYRAIDQLVCASRIAA